MRSVGIKAIDEKDQFSHKESFMPVITWLPCSKHAILMKECSDPTCKIQTQLNARG